MRVPAPRHNGGVTVHWTALDRADAAAVADLATRVAAHDRTHEVTTETGVREMFDQPRFDPAAQTLAARDGERLLAFGSVWPSDEAVEGRALVMIPGGVDPEHRGQGLGGRLLAGLQERAAAVAADRLPGHPVRFRTPGGLPDSDSQRLLEDSGYRPDNYFVTMQVDLAGWADPGTASRAVAPTPSLTEAIREAHNDAFRDHRNFSPIPADRWQAWQGSERARPALARVVVEDGRVLAYAMADEDEPTVLHTGILGTRREARGRGLARELLVATLRAAREEGYAIAELEVDSTSPTGADRLYAAVGYRQVRVISRYVKDADTGS